jgi:hypothetical protein
MLPNEGENQLCVDQPWPPGCVRVPRDAAAREAAATSASRCTMTRRRTLGWGAMFRRPPVAGSSGRGPVGPHVQSAAPLALFVRRSDDLWPASSVVPEGRRVHAMDREGASTDHRVAQEDAGAGAPTPVFDRGRSRACVRSSRACGWTHPRLHRARLEGHIGQQQPHDGDAGRPADAAGGRPRRRDRRSSTWAEARTLDCGSPRAGLPAGTIHCTHHRANGPAGRIWNRVDGNCSLVTTATVAEGAHNAWLTTNPKFRDIQLADDRGPEAERAI